MRISTVVDLIKRPSIQKRLAAMVTQLTRKNYPTHVKIDGGSYTDGKLVVIGVPLQITTEMIDRGLIATEEHVVSILKGLTIHESEHIRSSSFSLFREFVERVEADYLKHNIRGAGIVIGKGIMNSVEDGRVERRAINRMKGIGKHLRFMNLVFFQVVGQIRKNLLSDYLMSICVLATSNMYLRGWGEEYRGTDIHKLLDECVPLIREGVNAETPTACFDVCMKIHELSMPVLLPHIKEDLTKQKHSQQFAQDGDIERNPRMDNSDPNDAPGSKEKQYSDSEKGAKQKPKDNSSDQNQKNNQSGSSKGKTKDDPNEEEPASNKEDITPSNSSQADEDEDGETFEPLELTPEELKQLIEELTAAINEENGKMLKDAARDDAQSAKAASHKKAQREKNQLSPKEISDISKAHRARYITLTSTDALDSTSNETASELERFLLRIFRNMNQEERRYKRSGSVDKRSLTRLIINRDADIFYQSAKNAIRPAAFCLNIDHSGSMSGNKMNLALRAASIVQAAIQKHFPLRVLGFSSSGKETTLYDYKAYDDSANGSLLKFVGNSNNANCDGYAIEVAAAELARRQEEIKVLIVMSDGYPTVSYKNDPIQDAKNAVINARKKGIIVIAIVFGVDSCDRHNFETIYEKNIIMCEPRDIEKNLGKEIEKIVRVM